MLKGILFVAFIVAAPAFAAELRDPTRPPAARRAAPRASGSAELPVLRSIVVSPHRRVAQIGGRRVVPGDRILGGRVARIERTAVYITKGDKELILRLAEAVATRSVDTRSVDTEDGR